MLRKRVIPVLLMQKKALYKTVRFSAPVYVGDPANAIKIFNEKEVDELIVLDIQAEKGPDFEYIEQLAGECFMPLCYGGGVFSLDHIKRLNELGIEKVAVNTRAAEDPSFIEAAAANFGSSTIVVSADVKKDFWGKYYVHTHNGKKKTSYKAEEFAVMMEEKGAGELMLTSVDRDGTGQGYDTDLIAKITSRLSIPVIACGGASGLADLKKAFESGASAVAAGSLFVFYGKNKAVLINYPSDAEIRSLSA